MYPKNSSWYAEMINVFTNLSKYNLKKWDIVSKNENGRPKILKKCFKLKNFSIKCALVGEMGKE